MSLAKKAVAPTLRASTPGPIARYQVRRAMIVMTTAYPATAGASVPAGSHRLFATAMASTLIKPVLTTRIQGLDWPQPDWNT